MGEPQVPTTFERSGRPARRRLASIGSQVEPNKKGTRLGAFFVWLRRLDLNQRPSGYELRFVCGGETFRLISGPVDSENHALWPCLFHWFHGF